MQYMKIVLISLILALLFKCSLFSEEKSAENKNSARPNIVFLFADDQRADTVAAHENNKIKTPNLDSLASEGISFRQNYCAGSYSGAVCIASRAMLMTGRQWLRIPSQWRDLKTFPKLLSENGYKTFIVGKWHNGAATLRASFEEGESVFLGGMSSHTSVPVRTLKKGVSLNKVSIPKGFSSQIFADSAIKFIKKQDGSKPFLLYVAFTAPHDPRMPPDKYRQYYYDNRPLLPPNFLPEHPFNNGFVSSRGRDEGLAAWPRTKEVINDQLCEYYGLITHLDEQVGRVIKAVKESPHGKNTVIIYTADHGLAMGSHGLLGKQNIYEHSMKCPLIISGPGFPKGKSTDALTYLHDLNATICDLSGTEAAKDCDSKSLMPIITGEKETLHSEIFLPFQNIMRSVRSGKWKLHVYPKINHKLLFDLSTDPHELNNLAENPLYKENVERLMIKLKKWQKEVGDKCPLHVKNPLPLKYDFSKEKRSLDVWQPKWIRDKYFDGRTDAKHGRLQHATEE